MIEEQLHLEKTLLKRKTLSALENNSSSLFLPHGLVILTLASIMITIPSIIVFKEFRITQRYLKQNLG